MKLTTEPTTLGLAPAIARVAAATPDKVAIRYRDQALSYADLERHIAAAAWTLQHRHRLSSGDRIAYLGLNSPESLILLFAADSLGLILVPLNWRLAVPELSFILTHAGARHLFVDEAFRATAEHLEIATSSARLPQTAPPDRTAAPAHSDADRPLLLVFTSGTTGRPKGTVLSRRAVLANAEASGRMHGLTAADRVLTVLPTFHVGGLNIQTLPALLLGASVILHERFEPKATLLAIARERPSLTVLVPTVMRALLGHPDWHRSDLSSLRAIAAGSTDVPVDLIEAFHARGVPVIQVYGATETGPIAIYQRVEEAFETVGSIGRAGPHNRIRLVDAQNRAVEDGEAGELLIKGPNVATGYWEDAAATAVTFEDGWFRSGDIAQRDAAGLYWFKDRKKNVIISGGENIYPAEIERVLGAVPGVAEVSVVGRPDPRWGAVPVAVVVLGADPETQVREWIRSGLETELARYKHPKDVIFVDALPRNAMGKVEIERVQALVRRRAAST